MQAIKKTISSHQSRVGSLGNFVENIRVSQEFMKAVPQSDETDQDEVVIMSPKISQIKTQESCPEEKKLKKSIVFQYRHVDGKLKYFTLIMLVVKSRRQLLKRLKR